VDEEGHIILQNSSLYSHAIDGTLASC